jgi:mono/diheme cytochrome c family protein
VRPYAILVLIVATSAVGFAQTRAGGVPASAKATADRKSAPLQGYGIGRLATPEEIKAIDIDVMPNGRGLPPGRGTVAEGAAVYAAKCAACHGAKGQGGSADRLGGGEGNQRTVGNYWPYATTLYDYTFRSMPFMQPGSLTPNETYGLVAFILHLNGIVPETAVMDATTLPNVMMPARNKFVPDNRTGGKVVK